MTLKKYNVIIYFTIILILVVNVVIAQEHTNTLEHSSPTTIAKSPETTSIPKSSESNTAESCLEDTSCISANDTLKLCNGSLKTPDKYIEEGTRSGIYRPEDRGLARCMCNQPYYDTLSKCLECFVNATNTEFNVSPIEDYKKQCEKAGTTFTQTMPTTIKSTISPKMKWGLIGGILLLVIGIIGFIVFKRYRKKNLKEKHKISVEGSGNDGKYPPPQSPSVHYRYEYAPPTDTPYYPPPPGGQDGQYPPPPQQHGVQGGQGSHYPPPPQQHGGGQGGQSDSYYTGSF